MKPRKSHSKALQLAALSFLLGVSGTSAALSAATQDMGSMTVFHVPTEVQTSAKTQVKTTINQPRSGSTKQSGPANAGGSGVRTISSGANSTASKSTAATVPARMVPSGFLDIASSVTPAFVNEIEIAMQKLPANTVRALSQRGYRMCISRTVPDAVPAARNQQVRGYEPTATWNSVFGMFNRSTKRVVMAETAELPDGLGGTKVSKLYNRERRQGIVRHEFGHAVDQYLGNFSHTQQFKAAYDHGAADISAPERQVLNYYLQPGDAGKEETFAELFAALDGDACDKNSDILLRNHFSQLAKLIRQKVASI